MVILHTLFSPCLGSSSEDCFFRRRISLYQKCVRALCTADITSTASFQVPSSVLQQTSLLVSLLGRRRPFYTQSIGQSGLPFSKTDCSLNNRTPPLAFDTLLLGLALFKATEFWKTNGYSGSRLVLVLIKDQALYYTL